MRTYIIRAALAALIAIPTTAAAAGSISLPATGQTACFAANGNPAVCAGTGQDGDIRAGVAWPVTRFTDNANGTVTDALTGLVWSKHANAPDINPGPAFVCANAESDMSWQQALDHIKCLNTNSYLGSTDWRLPNLNELESMINSGAADTSVYLSNNGFGTGGLVTEVQSSEYWSSTTDASDAAFAWDVNFLEGDFPFSSVKIPVVIGLDTRAVWLVRGVSNGPAALPATGQSTCFDAAGAAAACAGSGQDGEKLAGAVWPAPRFKANAAGTLTLDRLTGLVWTTASKTTGPANPAPAGCAVAGTPLTSWQAALDHANCLKQNSFLGLADWRLPNRKELRSLVDHSRSAPALPAGHPFSDLLQGDTFWSSTTDASQPGRAWTVNMFDGSLGASGKINGGVLSAWPVSGPDLVAPAIAITQGNMTTGVASQTISGTVEAGATVTVANNGGTPAAAVVTGTTWSFTAAPLAVGANNITVTATDFSENISTASISITLDTAAPALALNPVTALTKVASQTLSGTVEAGATVTVKLGTTVIPTAVSGTTWSSDITNLAEGANAITVTAIDAVGNTSTLPPATITLDTVPPVTTVSPVPGAYLDSVPVTLTAPEAGSTIYYTTDGSAVTTSSPVYSAPLRLAATTNTPFTVQFMAVDQAGNAEPAKSVAYTIQVGCDFNGDNKVDVSDALKALQITIGLSSSTPEEKKRADVAPLVNGKPAPDDIIDIRDTLVILQRSVGLVSPW